MSASKRLYSALILIVCGICFVSHNVSATTWISAEGFYSMYRLAASGNVEALKKSDLPIDGVNRDEDTGLCYSARRRNAVAWNAYLDAGANPNPECAGRVPGYREFAAASRVVTTTTIISTAPILYGVGAAALIGGGIALAAGGGGGGGGSHKKNCDAYPYEICPTGYHKTDECTADGKTKYKCEINDCSAYPYTTCPDNTHVVDTCMSGSTPKYKCEPYNNYNNPEVGGILSGNTTTLTKTNTGNENVIGLEYIVNGDKVGISTTLYNGYYETDAEHSASDDRLWIINATNTGTGETSGMSNSAGNETVHLFVDGTNVALTGTYTAQTNVTASGANGNVYGIYSQGNVSTLGGVNYAGANFNSSITVNSSGLNKKAYGIYSTASASNNLLSGATSSSSTVTVNQTHTDSTTPIYGIKSLTGAVNEGTITINNYGYGAGYGIKNDSGIVTNSGTISATNNIEGVQGFGVENSSGSVTNSGTITAATTGISSPTVVNSGKITVENITTDNNLALYGIYGSNVTNTGLKSEDKGIYVNLKYSSSTTADRAAYGIYGSSTTNNNIVNQGDIKVELKDEADGDAKVYGIYNQGLSSTVLNDTSGCITISSDSSVGPGRTRTVYGIYSTGGTVTNKGKIDIGATTFGEGATMYGIYATAGTIINQGTIKIQDQTCTGAACKTADPGYGDSAYIYAESGVTVNNLGMMMSAQPLHMSGNVLLGQGGTFEAPLISGDLGVSTSAVSEGFADSYTLSNAIVSEDTTGLNLSSESVMFDASLQGQDVVLNKKDFTEVVESSSVAKFLEQNYQLQNNESLYNNLKEKTSKASLNDAVKDLMGDGLKRFAFEDMTMFKELSLDMNEKMFSNKKAEFTLTGNTQPISFEKNLGSRSRWSLSGKRSGNMSYGVGVAFTDIKSQDGNKDNNRTDEMFQMMMPVGYETHGFEMISTPRLGYAYGHYTRDGYKGKNYDGKVEKRIFGVTNEVRYPINIFGWKVSPTAEFNAIGYHIKGHEEDEEFALNINKQNIWSVEGGVGFSLAKEIEFGKEHSLKIGASVMAYHEFADPYELELSMRGMEGSWKVRDEKRRDERLMVKNTFEYDFKPISVYANLYSYIDSEYRTKADIGFKYAF